LLCVEEQPARRILVSNQRKIDRNRRTLRAVLDVPRNAAPHRHSTG
jgi:hypothetical protein